MALDTSIPVSALTYNGQAFQLAGGGERPLPTGYTQLAYIESSGTQYIDTGILPQEDMQVEIAAVVTGSGWQNIVGSGSVILLQTSDANLSNVYFGGALQSSSMFFFTEVEDFLAVVNQTGVIRRGYARDLVKTTWAHADMPTTANNIWLFAANSGGSPSRPATMKCYAFRILVDGEKVCELIPAMRNSDQVVGMYDTAAGAFRTNGGSGVFSGGEL